MNDLRNKVNEKRAVTLTRIEFDAGNYKKIGKNIELRAEDAIGVSEQNKNGFILEFSRKIYAPKTDDFFSILVAYQIAFSYKKDCKSPTENMDEEEICKIAKDNADFFTAGCMSKISLLIGEISVQIGTSDPIVTPPNLLINLK